MDRQAMDQGRPCQYRFKHSTDLEPCPRMALPGAGCCEIHECKPGKPMPSRESRRTRSLREAYFVDARLKDGPFAGKDLSFANMEGAHLWNADLGGAYLERVNLSKADLFNAKLANAHLLWSATLDDVEINEARGDICWKCATRGETSVRCWWETPRNPFHGDVRKSKCQGGPVETIDAYLRAYVVNKGLKAHFRDTGWHDKSRRHYIRERILDGKKWRIAHRITEPEDFQWHFPEWNAGWRGTFWFWLRTRLKWLSNTFLHWATKYGESPVRIGVAAVLFIGICGTFYWALNQISPGAIERLSSATDANLTPRFSEYYLLSTMSFAGLSFGLFSLTGWLAILAVSMQTIIGIFTFAYLVVVLSRRIMRD